ITKISTIQPIALEHHTICACGWSLPDIQCVVHNKFCILVHIYATTPRNIQSAIRAYHTIAYHYIRLICEPCGINTQAVVYNVMGILPVGGKWYTEILAIECGYKLIYYYEWCKCIRRINIYRCKDINTIMCSYFNIWHIIAFKAINIQMKV